MKFLRWGKDGGPESPVWGFCFIEIKWLFSIVLLRFDGKAREAFHSHAFNALTWWLRGEVVELFKDGKNTRCWRPSIWPKFTRRSCFHRVIPMTRTWALSFRGPWAENWQEYKRGETTTFGHGRKVVSQHETT